MPMSKVNYVTYLKDNLARSIGELQILISHTTGYFTVVRSALAYCDYLGQLRYGVDESKTTERAVKFMREYLGCINHKWKQIAPIVYNMFRHGTVHHYHPKSYDLEGCSLSNIGTRYIGWSIAIDDGRKHLQILPHPDVRDTSILHVSAFHLIMELRQAIEFYAVDVEQDHTSVFDADPKNYEKLAAPQKPRGTVVDALRRRFPG